MVVCRNKGKIKGMRRVPQKHGGVLQIPEKGDPSPNKTGRPRKLVSHVLAEMKEKGITPVKPRDVVDVYEQMLNYSEEDIVSIVNNKELPYFIRLIASAMTTKGRGFEIVERMIDRAHGGSKMNVEVVGNPFLAIMQAAGDKNDENVSEKKVAKAPFPLLKKSKKGQK